MQDSDKTKRQVIEELNGHLEAVSFLLYSGPASWTDDQQHPRQRQLYPWHQIYANISQRDWKCQEPNTDSGVSFLRPITKALLVGNKRGVKVEAVPGCHFALNSNYKIISLYLLHLRQQLFRSIHAFPREFNVTATEVPVRRRF